MFWLFFRNGSFLIIIAYRYLSNNKNLTIVTRSLTNYFWYLKIISLVPTISTIISVLTIEHYKEATNLWTKTEQGAIINKEVHSVRWKSVLVVPSFPLSNRLLILLPPLPPLTPAPRLYFLLQFIPTTSQYIIILPRICQPTCSFYCYVYFIFMFYLPLYTFNTHDHEIIICLILSPN